MPSVRVRRSTVNSTGEDRSLAAIFAAGQQSDEVPPLPPAPPFLQNSVRGSKIHSHIAGTRGRANSVARTSVASGGAPPRTTSPDSNGRATTPLSHHSGAQTDIVVRARSDGEPGLIGSALSLPHSDHANDLDFDQHGDDIVEHLDVIDPQVGTVSTLTNAANALLFPPTWYSRKPVVTLSSPETIDESDPERGARPGKEYEDSLDRHVDDLLNKPSKFKRTMKGVWAFLKTPLGVLAGIYGFCVVFWGAAIVFFLAKFINLHNENTQGFWVEVSSQVENGLFTVTGIGLIPSRVLDTYRIYWIWYYKRRTRVLRAKAGLPQLFDVDDLPDPVYDPNYVHVLTEKEQKFLHRQQVKFQRHQTWYRAHGTETHRAFPINTALLICCLNDGNSIFQIMLCGTMWGLDRFQRPAWSTGILIPASFLCGIGAAVFIAIGGNHTKRVEKVKERLRAALAMEHPATNGAQSDPDLRPNGSSVDAEKKLTNGHSMQRNVSELGAETALDERMIVPPANEKGTV
ncbi:hypothetical protein DFH08DRAFT_831328 [Mycena albidolilacea]|uniref:Uncharacterized protein n=1 Tax=Mycena albidolilacea TaxID=1033008 RepID=A0AAD7AV12_9AGAR|nr:hypothetical protein DFH08DRAFT_831328 [Mycena albidolilacea]